MPAGSVFYSAKIDEKGVFTVFERVNADMLVLGIDDLIFLYSGFPV